MSLIHGTTLRPSFDRLYPIVLMAAVQAAITMAWAQDVHSMVRKPSKI